MTPKMRWRSLGFVLAVGVAAVVGSGNALADRGRVHFGLYFGVPIWGPSYYYPQPYPYPYYYPPTVVVPSAPPTYVEQPAPHAVPAQPQQSWWYYCPAAKAYYPYVRECPSGWQRVAPQPPPQ